MKQLINELKKGLRSLATAEIKAVESYKKSASVLLQLAEIDAIKKSEIIKVITETLQSRGLSESTVKKIRGGLMAFYEGAKKYPQKIDMIKVRLDNIDTRKGVEEIGRNFKKSGETETPQKEIGPKPKGKKSKEVLSVERADAYTFISRIVNISEDKFYKLDDDKIIKLVEEVEKIIRLIG